MRRRRPASAFDIIRQADREARSLPGAGGAPASPIDLSRAFGDAEWKALRALRRDVRYRQAVATLKARYSLVSNPLLLPNTLREAMDRLNLRLAEAVLLVSEGEEASKAR
jgi:hypothetical protein